MITPTQARRFWAPTIGQVEMANSMVPGGVYTVTWWYPGKDATAEVEFVRLEPLKKSVSVVFIHSTSKREFEIPAQFLKVIVH